MSTAICTLCNTEFPRTDTRPVTSTGWCADGWVWFNGAGAQLQPYCPVCLPAAQVAKDANSSNGGSPWIVYHPKAGGRIRAVRYEFNPEADPTEGPTVKVGTVFTTPHAVEQAMECTVGPGHLDAVWATLSAAQHITP